MTTPRARLQTLAVDRAGNIQRNKLVTITRDSGGGVSAPLGQSLYDAETAGNVITTPKTNDEGYFEGFAALGDRVLVLVEGDTLPQGADLLPHPGQLVTLDGTQTLVNKTLTAPTISAPTVSGLVTLSSPSGKVIQALQEALPGSYANISTDYTQTAYQRGTTAAPYTGYDPMWRWAAKIRPSTPTFQVVSQFDVRADINGTVVSSSPGVQAWDYHHGAFHVVANAIGDPYSVIGLTSHVTAEGTAQQADIWGMIVSAQQDSANGGAQGIEIDLTTGQASRARLTPNPILGTVSTGSDFVAGINIGNAGGFKASTGLYFQAAASSGFRAAILFGGGAVTSGDIGIDMRALLALGGAYPLVLANGASFYSASGANNDTFVPMLGLDSSDRAILGSTLWADGVNGRVGINAAPTTDAFEITGNMRFQGASRRIIGSLSAATSASQRLAVQGSGTTLLTFLPGGATRVAGIDMHDQAAANGAGLQISTQPGEGRISAYDAGGGAPFLSLYTGNLERLRLDGNGLTISAARLGLFSATPSAKLTVTGSRGGNAALASLLTQLATYGLVTDSSSA
jgi:hypothetical protein